MDRDSVDRHLLAPSMSIPGPDLRIALWNWYVTFFLHFGSTLAVAIPIAGAAVMYGVLYRAASALEARPLSAQIRQQFLARSLSGFNLLFGGILTVSAWGLILYLLGLVWKLTPQMVDLPESAQTAGFGSLDEAMSRVATIALLSALVGAGVATAFFSAMRTRALASDQGAVPAPLISRRCFVESPMIGVVIAIALWWTVFNLGFDIWNLVQVLVPASRGLIPRLSEPERVYFAILSTLASYYLGLS
jgi:hypothetical protein